MSMFQNAFPFERQILDATLISNEAINSMLKRDSSGVICKLVIEKVCDHVNWTFLLIVLEKIGFGQKGLIRLVGAYP